jgi:hypothetical protein
VTAKQEAEGYRVELFVLNRLKHLTMQVSRFPQDSETIARAIVEDSRMLAAVLRILLCHVPEV